jgi:PAS domain S-box-containing protein
VVTTETANDAEASETIRADRQGVITHWGSECAETLGYSPEEAVGQRVDLIIPPALQARHWQGFDKAMDNGKLKRPGKTLKVPAIHKSGAVLALEGALTLNTTNEGAADSVTLKLHGEGPGWAPPLWRIVLAILKPVNAISRRIQSRRN